MNPNPLAPEFWKEFSSRHRKSEDRRFLQPDFWDRLASEYNELEGSSFYRAMVEEIVSTMRARGALSPHGRVFDVACGPGNYALRFAPYVKEVVGLDISREMIARFEKRFKEAGLTNYRTILADWFSFETKERFETVFVSMSPILHDLNSLDRLLALATRFLVLVHWAGVRENLLHKRLVREVLGRDLFWKKPGIIVPFNYLYVLGYPGDLRFFCGFWERRRLVDKELEHLLWRLEAQGLSPTEKEKKRLRELLLKEADQEGCVFSRTKVRIGFLLVEVSGPCVEGAAQAAPDQSRS